MPAKKTSAPKHTYQMMVTRHITYQFEMEAKTAEQACQKLQRRLRTDDTLQTEAGGIPLFYQWSDPKEPCEEWAVMCTTPSKADRNLLLFAWDGQKFIALGEGEIGDDIAQVMRNLYDPRAKRAKRKKTA